MKDNKDNKGNNVFYTSKKVREQLSEMIDSYLKSQPKVLNA